MALSAASEPQNDTVLIAEGRGLFLSTDLASLAFSFFFSLFPGRVWPASGENG